MASHSGRGDRGGNRKRKGAARSRRTTTPPQGRAAQVEDCDGRRRYRISQRFGRVPLIPHLVKDAGGQVRVTWDYDPDFAPPMPAGAVRGDIRHQRFCRRCHEPRWFYVDQRRDCVQCGGAFVFRASEQKYWYEVRQFHFDSVAIRCPACRRARRSERTLQARIMAAKRATQEHPQHALHWLELAQAILDLHERTGHGRIAEALGAARRAARDRSLTMQAGEVAAACRQRLT